MSGGSHLTQLGLPDIEVVPYGLHACHFYEGADDLEDVLVRYFAAGLRNRERCFWITADPLKGPRARAALEKAGFDVVAEEHGGALVIKDFSDWYSGASQPKGVDIVKLWLAEEERALAQGFKGLRITGNVTFLTDAAWPEFMEYEKAVDEAFYGRRIIALCTYQSRIGPSNLLDVVRRHDCALERCDQGWQVMTATSSSLAVPAS